MSSFVEDRLYEANLTQRGVAHYPDRRHYKLV